MILTLIDLFYYCNYENNTTVLENNYNYNWNALTVTLCFVLLELLNIEYAFYGGILLFI